MVCRCPQSPRRQIWFKDGRLAQNRISLEKLNAGKIQGKDPRTGIIIQFQELIS